MGTGRTSGSHRVSHLGSTAESRITATGTYGGPTSGRSHARAEEETVEVLRSVVIGLLLMWALEFIMIVAVVAVAFLKPRAVTAPRAEKVLAEVGSFEVAAAPAASA
jgi:hypothetical protein